MNIKYVVVFRYRNFFKRLFSMPKYYSCRTWREVEELIAENGIKYTSEVDCLEDIRV
ncbi:MAG: hypothetical protein ACRC5S_05400 [Cetobacterium sp.]